jgi:5-methylcytosine-specific restriction endonuclease McrA
MDTPDAQTLHVKKEREKARALRKTSWWQQKMATAPCYYCQTFPIPPADKTMDHVIPLSKGGKSHRGNTVLACKTCNHQKKHMTGVDWVLKQLEAV